MLEENPFVMWHDHLCNTLVLNALIIESGDRNRLISKINIWLPELL